MVGLGRAVGAGSDLVILWSPGTGSGLVEALRHVCLTGTRAVEAALTAQRLVEAEMTARRDVEAEMTARRDVEAALSGARTTSTAVTATVHREC